MLYAKCHTTVCMDIPHGGMLPSGIVHGAKQTVFIIFYTTPLHCCQYLCHHEMP